MIGLLPVRSRMRIVLLSAGLVLAGVFLAACVGCGGDGRSAAEVLALIEKDGPTQPAWWDSVELTYPQTLDLTGRKNPRDRRVEHNLRLYIGRVISADPAKWRSGIKLLHKAVEVRADDPVKQRLGMHRLARYYLLYEEDYARAAYWWRKAVDAGMKGKIARYRLAECYWRLGGKTMAAQKLREFGLDQGVTYGMVVEFWAALGEVELARKLADNITAKGRKLEAAVSLGNVYRALGQLDQARAHYEKAMGEEKLRGHALMHRRRAAVALEAIDLAGARDAIDLARVPDGVYTGVSDGFRGPIKVQVTIQAGRIQAVKVVESDEDTLFMVRAVHFLPSRIVKAQSLSDVDAVSGATVSSDAIINAATKALTAVEKK